jgi:hypothetical protein
MKSAGVDDARGPMNVIIGLMRMAIEEILEIASLLEMAHRAIKVAVGEAKFVTCDFQYAKWVMQFGANLPDGFFERFLVMITVAKDKMGIPAGE